MRNNQLSELPESIALLADTLVELLLEGNSFDEEAKENLLLWLPDTNIYFDADVC